VATAPRSSTRSASPFPVIAQLSTPLPRTTNRLKELFAQPSAMKGVVLTATGEALATPSPAELAGMFDLSRRFEDEVGASPKVGLNFAQVFDFEDRDEGAARACESPLKSESEVDDEDADSEAAASATSSWRTSRARSRNTDSEPSTSSTAPPTRLRRPSIRTSARRPTLPASISDPTGLAALTPEAGGSQPKNKPKPLPHPHLASTSSSQPIPPQTARANTAPMPRSHPAPEYDLNDEENLPSPFLKRADRAAAAAGSSAVGTGSAKRTLTKRPSSGNFLRVVAAANASAGKRGTSTSRPTTSRPGSVS